MTAKVFDVVNFGESLFLSRIWIEFTHLGRYDQYHKAWIQTTLMLLGAQTRASTSFTRRV